MSVMYFCGAFSKLTIGLILANVKSLQSPFQTKWPDSYELLMVFYFAQSKEVETLRIQLSAVHHRPVRSQTNQQKAAEICGPWGFHCLFHWGTEDPTGFPDPPLGSVSWENLRKKKPWLSHDIGIRLSGQLSRENRSNWHSTCNLNLAAIANHVICAVYQHVVQTRISI